MTVHALPYNPFAENTYLLADSDGTCAIVDPGCYTPAEQQHLLDYVIQHRLTPVRLLLTHAHIDHVFGCAFVARQWGLRPELHRDEAPLLRNLPQQSQFFGMPAEPAPEPAGYLVPGTALAVGSLRLEVLFTPGHSPASVCLFHRDSKQVISGDVLFAGSIGRTDLPGGSLETLMHSIYQVLLPLGDEVQVYPGHGPATTIGRERRANPFLQS